MSLPIYKFLEVINTPYGGDYKKNSSKTLKAKIAALEDSWRMKSEKKAKVWVQVPHQVPS